MSYVNDYLYYFIIIFTHPMGKSLFPPFHVAPRSGLKAHTSPPSQNLTHHLLR